MYWKLQHFKCTSDKCEIAAVGDWVDTVVGPFPRHQFKSKREAFDYYFGKHGDKRELHRKYRLTPVFSTKPVNIVIKEAFTNGRWVLPDYGSQPAHPTPYCPNCGAASHPVR